MKFFAGLESNCFTRSNGDFSACSGIAADACFAWLNGEHTEAAQFDAVARDQGLLHAVEDGVDGVFRFGPRQSGPFDDPLD